MEANNIWQNLIIIRVLKRKSNIKSYRFCITCNYCFLSSLVTHAINCSWSYHFGCRFIYDATSNKNIIYVTFISVIRMVSYCCKTKVAYKSASCMGLSSILYYFNYFRFVSNTRYLK